MIQPLQVNNNVQQVNKQKPETKKNKAIIVDVSSSQSRTQSRRLPQAPLGNREGSPLACYVVCIQLKRVLQKVCQYFPCVDERKANLVPRVLSLQVRQPRSRVVTDLPYLHWWSFFSFCFFFRVDKLSFTDEVIRFEVGRLGMGEGGRERLGPNERIEKMWHGVKVGLQAILSFFRLSCCFVLASILC